MARTEYGGLRVWPSIDERAGRADHPGVDADPDRPAAAAADLHRLGAGRPQLVDHVEHGLGAARRGRCPRWSASRRDPSRRPCRSGSTARPAGPARSRSRPGRCCPTPAADASVALQVGHFGVQRGLPLLQRIQQHQQIGGSRRLQRVAGLVLPDLGDDRDAQQHAQQHGQRAEHQLRPAPARHALHPAGVQIADLRRRLVGRQFVASAPVRGTARVFRLARALLAGSGSLRLAAILTRVDSVLMRRTVCAAGRRRCRRSGCRAPR